MLSYCLRRMVSMPVLGSLSANFSGPLGALAMSLIALSIVFLVIIGLMFIMAANAKAAKALDRSMKSGEERVR
jgi:hypothetical protein